MDIHAILAVVLCLVLKKHKVEPATSLLCLSSQYEHQGFCCNKCRPGTFVLTRCNKTIQTVCQPCQEGTFSSEWMSRNECTVCGNNHCQPTMSLTQICNSTVDNKCGCPDPNEFYNHPTDSCEACKRCAPGYYPWRPCTEETQCIPCPENYFTNKSRTKEQCIKCTDCNHYDRICNSTYDAVCLPEVIFVQTTQQWEGLLYTKSTFTETQGPESSKDYPVIIVSVFFVCVLVMIIVAAVFWKKRKVTFLTGDGFSVIEESRGRTFSFGGLLLRDQPATVLLGLHQMLNHEAPNNWRTLAALLAVPYLLIRNYDVKPGTAAEDMLCAWGASNAATIDRLYQCLKKIGREDVCIFLEESVEMRREETSV